MPRGTKSGAKDAALKQKIADKRKGKPEQFPAQTLADINVRRGRLIAKQLGIKNAGKYSFPAELVPMIKEKMALIQDCVECNGPCQPDLHTFPAVVPEPVDPNAEVEADEESDTSSLSSRTSIADGDDSPSRSVFRNLQSLGNPNDQTVPGANPAQSFAAHVHDEINPEDTSGTPPSLPAPGVSGTLSPLGVATRASRSSRSSKEQTEAVSSSSDEDDEEERRQNLIAAARARQEKELEEARKVLQEKSKKKSEAQLREEKRKRKEERARIRAEKDKQLLDEMEKKHQETLAAIRQASVGDDDVFTAPSRPRVTLGVDSSANRASRAGKDKSGSHKSRNKSRVSFEETTRRTTSPRSSSEQQERDFHPEYRGSTSRSKSTGSNVEVEILVELMDRQQKSAEMLTAAFEKMANSGSRSIPIADLDGFGASGGAPPAKKTSSSGYLRVVQDGDSDMARALGVNPGLKLEFTGDLNEIDPSKLKKTMISGKHRKNSSLVVRQHVWPHDVVSRASAHLWPKTKDFELGHWDQSFAMFQEGVCQKILVDHHKDIDPIIKNKLRFQAYLIRQSYVLSWDDILSVSEQFLNAWEYNVVHWDSWPDIEKFLKDACEQARMSSLARAGSVPAASAVPSQAAGAAAKNKAKAEGNLRGIPWRFMKDKGICCGYNSGSCNQTGEHTINNAKVQHWCGGCFGSSKGSSKLEHRAKTCDKGPWDKSLFQ